MTESMWKQATSFEAMVPIRSVSDASITRRQARKLGESIGFKAIEVAMISAVAANLAHAIADTAETGRIEMNVVYEDGRIGASLTAHFRPPVDTSNRKAVSLGRLLQGMERMDDIQIRHEKTENVLTMKKWLPDGKSFAKIRSGF